MQNNRKIHTRDNNKFRLKSKAMNNPSLLTEVIYVERQSEGLETVTPSIVDSTGSKKKDKGKSPSDQKIGTSIRRKIQKSSEEKKTIAKETTMRTTRSKSVVEKQIDLDKLARVVAHMEER